MFIALFLYTALFFNQPEGLVTHRPKDSIIAEIDSPVLTISFDINVKTSLSYGAFDTYNGGIKTYFVNNKVARIRQVSLMRIQSIFIFPITNKIKKPYLVVKESGAEKYKFNMSSGEWKFYNAKYDSAVFSPLTDTVSILGFNCKKGEVILKDGKKIVVCYTDKIKNKLINTVDPLFEKIPGVVLQFSYEAPNGTIIFTATDVNTKPINRNVFQVPGLGYNLIDYVPGKEPVNLGELMGGDDDADAGGDDDE